MRRVGLRRKRIPTQLTDREATIMEYFEPKSISEALSVLAKHGAEAKVIAGGTDVMVDIKFKEEPGSPGKHQEAPRHERHQRERRQPAHRRADDDPRSRNQRSGARKIAGALGSRASIRVIASAQHRDHRRQHLPRFAFGRNPGAAARTGSDRQVRFLGRRKEPSRSRRSFRDRENPFSARKAY